MEKGKGKAELKDILIKGMIGAGVVIIAALGIQAVTGEKEEKLPVQISQVSSAQDSPMGMRKFMNYNGHRYAFLENGAEYTITQQEPQEVLGTLEYDIAADPKANGSVDFASTFALGGEVKTIELYDPAFRVAVELDGKQYICENVDQLGDVPLDAKAYFETADFENNVEEIEICDHMGSKELKTISGEDAKKMMELISQSEETKLTNDQYQEIGQAQSGGESFQLHFVLKDKTEYKLYVIPSLEISMIGDNRCKLPKEFAEQYGELFAGLPREALPMH